MRRGILVCACGILMDVMAKKSASSQSHEKNNNRKPEPLFTPSWTGPHESGVGSKRVHRWLCEPDKKCPTNETENDFTANINWRIFRIMAEFIEGFEFLSKLKREVTIFGSARTPETSRYYKIAKELGAICGKAGFTVITGGGPGIMEAANRGAFEAGGESVGLDISLPLEQRRNPYVRSSMGFHYFFTRKVMLSASAQAYVFFPGGYGTLDELFEVATLIQTGKMSSGVPIILVGHAFWMPMLDWIEHVMWEEDRYIDKPDVGILQVVDSAEEAYRIIHKTKERTL